MTRQSDDVDREVGRRLSTFRKAAGMTQSQLAEHLGVRAQQVCKFEVGKNRLCASKLYLAAEALGVPVSAFFDPAEKPPPAPIEEIASLNLSIADLKLLNTVALLLLKREAA